MEISFFKNTDNFHCMQACMKMILKYYFPKKTLYFKQIDELIGLGNRKL